MVSIFHNIKPQLLLPRRSQRIMISWSEGELVGYDSTGLN